MQNSLENKIGKGQGNDPRTYDDYLSLSKNNTKNYLMISELIDNSISSFENRYGDEVEQWPEKLEIEFGYIFKDKEYKTKEGYKYYPNNSFYLIDNAFGIQREQLRDVIRLNVKNNKTKSTKNRHGRGLKQCAFYFGMDLHVYTKRVKEEASHIKLCGEANLINDEIDDLYPREWFDCNLERGTKIQINNIHYNRKISANAMINILLALSIRFGKFIQKDKLVINYKNVLNHLKNPNDEIQNEKIWNLLEGEVEKPIIGEENFYADVESMYEKQRFTWGKTGFIKNYKETLDDFKSNPTSKTFNKVDFVVVEKAKNAMSDLISGDDSTKFKFILNLDYEDISVPITFFKIGNTKNFSKWRGITVYEGNRPIKHGPIVVGEQSTYLEWQDNSTSTGSTDNRFGGFFDLLDIDQNGQYTKSDKSDFELESEFKKSLDKFIYSVWKTFDIIENAGRNNRNNTHKPDLKNIEAVMSSKHAPEQKVNINFEKIELSLDDKDENAKLTAKLTNFSTIASKNAEINGIKLEIKPTEANWLDPNILIRKHKYYEERKRFIMTYNPKANLFQNATKLKDYHAEVLIPVLLQFASYLLNNTIENKGESTVDMNQMNNVDSKRDNKNDLFSGENFD